MFFFSHPSSGLSETTVHDLCRKSKDMRYGYISLFFTGPVKNRESLDLVIQPINIIYECKDMAHNK